ncbi:13550_t:CDS:2 [Dentiscutata erythropus]|uniref:13550_t:CDS:1 n=1 Tax=Dentiscutata erythropus TaxID=1348616 RepID=A0A9N8WEV3_9GLOM|nr:13550_t:CDS:2 [Dentiscutata erythropus]
MQGLHILAAICVLALATYIIILPVWVVYNGKIVTDILVASFFKPKYNPATSTFECNEAKYYGEVSHTTFLEQISGFGSIAGLIFNIAVYGATSKLEETGVQTISAVINLEMLNISMDLLYFIFSFISIITNFGILKWEKLQKNSFLSKPKNFIHKKIFFFTIFFSITECFFEYAFYCTPKNVDTIFFFILTTVLTRSIASFFSNDKELKVKNIMIYGNKYKGSTDRKNKNTIDRREFVFLRLDGEEQIRKFIGQARLYLKVYRENDNKNKNPDMKDEEDIIDDDDQNMKNDVKIIEQIKEYYVYERYKDVRRFYQNKLLDPEDNKKDYNNSDEDIEKDYKISDKDSDEVSKKDSKKEYLFIKKHKYRSIIEKIIAENNEPILKYQKGLNIPGIPIIAKEIFRNAVSFVNVLEMGLFHYITYSHRSRKKFKKYKAERVKKLFINADVKKIAHYKNQDDINIDFLMNHDEGSKNTEMNLIKIDFIEASGKWFIIPELLEFFYDSKKENYGQKLREEFEFCEIIEEVLNDSSKSDQ